MGDAGDARAERLDEASEVHRGRLALGGGVRGEDDLAHRAVAEADEERLDLELVGADAVERRDRAVEDVVAAVELVRALDREEIGRLLDDADRLVAPLRVGTDAARVALGEPV